MPGSARRRVLRFDDGGWAEPVGNDVALDLVNTVAWRLDPVRAVDRLPDGPALVRWAHFVGLIDDLHAEDFTREVDVDPRLGDDIASQVRSVREWLYRVLQPVATGGEPSADDVEILRGWLVDVLGSARISGVLPLRWWAPLRTVRDLPVEIGLRAWSLLEGADPKRIRQCRDAACGWLFLDQTKNGSRVWCSSACGNRTRARRHYRRHFTLDKPARTPRGAGSQREEG